MNWRRHAFDEKEALERAGYEIWEEYPWHWVVSKYETKTKIHVWPTSGKVMAYFDSGATVYANAKELVAFMDRAFNPQLRTGMPTEDQIEADKEVQKLRKGFLDDWGPEDEYKNAADIDMI